jgi:hemerythrin-like metal-binding protein
VATAIGTIVLRAPDIAARYGGEEFVVILPETDHQGAAAVAENIRKAVEEQAIPHSTSLAAEHITISLGVATVSVAEVSAPEWVVDLADKALFSAKERGRNRVEIAIARQAPDSDHAADHSHFVKLVWRITDECGNATIDEQHRKLFEDANELLPAMIGGHPKDECLTLINRLLTDVLNHFRDEEVILRAAEYPFFVHHRHCHVDLLAKATALAEKYSRDKMKPGELFSFLAYDIIAQHMFIEDRRYIPYIEKHHSSFLKTKG